MFNPNKIKERYGALICRRCLNKKYKVHLIPDDCIYEYRYVCPRCREMHNIVSDLRFSGKMKMLLK